jgi:hypothetical protein
MISSLTVLSISGCEENVLDPQNSPPTAFISANPSEGTAPLESRIKVWGEDPDGIEDIDKYTLNIPSLNLSIEKNSPIDTLINFEESSNYIVKGIVEDSKNQTDSKNTYVTVLDPESPTAILNVNPSGGTAPLNSQITLSGEHPEGVENIEKYILSIQDLGINIEKSTPIDTVFTFFDPGNYTISGEVIDFEGLTGTDEANVDVTEPPQPIVNHDATLENLIDIKYTADFENLDEANLSVLKNGDQIFEKTITNPNPSEPFEYSKLFTYYQNPEITKGDYEFVLSWDDSVLKQEEGKEKRNPSRITSSKKETLEGRLGGVERSRTKGIEKVSSRENTSSVSTEIPNYLPEADFSGIETNFEEGDEITLDLEGRFSDPNPEDNPVPLNDAWPLDEYTNVSLNGYNLTINSTQQISENTNYEVMVEFGDNEGGINSETLSGTLWDLLDIHGYLEDTETRTEQQGIVRVYHSNDSMGPFTQLGEIPVGPSGEFNQKLEHKVSNLQDYIFIQGRMKDPATGEEKSYIRSIKKPSGDVSDLLLRVVPYEGQYPLSQHDISPEDFRRHSAEVLTSITLFDPPTSDPLEWNIIIRKWDFGIDPNAVHSFEEVVISKAHYDPDVLGHFTQQTAEDMKSRILDSNDIGALFKGHINDPSQVTIVEDHGPWNPPEDYGKIRIFPEQGIGGYALTNDHGQDGYIDIGRVRLGVNENGEITGYRTFAHEMGHICGFSGHAWTLPQELTIMRRWGDLFSQDPRFADRKLAMALYDESYTHQSGATQWYTHYSLGSKDFLGLLWNHEIENRSPVIVPSTSNNKIIPK